MKDFSQYGINPAKGRRYENVIYVLALIYHDVNRRVDGWLRKRGLSAVQFNILMLAAYQNGGEGLSQVQLAKRLIVSAGAVTKLVDGLEERGLLSRKSNPLSRRENLIVATAKGRELIDALWPGYDELVRSLTDKLPAAKQTLLAEALGEWFEKLQEEK